MEFLEPSISEQLEAVTIVGMYHYKDAHDKIVAVSHLPPEKQLLFLVEDVNNLYDKNAVVLHDGHTKLGHVATTHAPTVKKILDKLRKDSGQDHVLVVQVSPIRNDNFNWGSSLNIKVVGSVYGRIAMKHARGERWYMN